MTLNIDSYRPRTDSAFKEHRPFVTVRRALEKIRSEAAELDCIAK